jgi:hypothetical protein
MAISYDNSNFADLAGASSGSVSVTVGAGSSQGMFIGLFANTPTSLSVTVNSNAATQVTSVSDGGANHFYLYFYGGTASGSATVAVSGASNFYYLSAVSYFGVLGSVQANVTTTNSFSVTANPFTLSLTPTVSNNWTGIIMGMLPSSSWLSTMSNGTNSTGRQIYTHNPGSPYNGDFFMGDSNGTVATGSPFSMGVANATSSGSGTRVFGIMWTILPHVPTLFWVGGNGNWDTSTLTPWATTSGGSGGVSGVPDSTIAVVFDGNSGGGTATVAASVACSSLTMTGYTGTLAQSHALSVGGAFTAASGMTFTSTAAFSTGTTASFLGTMSIGGTFTIGTDATFANSMTISGSSGLNIGGSLTLGTSLTNTYTGTITFTATASKTITNNSNTLASNLVFNGSGGTWTLQDNLNTSGTLTITLGTLVGNAHNITVASTSNAGALTAGNGTLSFGNTTNSGSLTTGTGSQTFGTLSNSGTFVFGNGTLTVTSVANTGTMTMGTQSFSTASISTTDVMTLGAGTTITLTGTGTVWTGSGTLTASTATIKINNASSSSKTFSGGGLTYYNLYFSGAGTGTFIVTGSNTFNDFKCDTPPHTIQFAAGSKQILNTFTVNGTAGNLMTLQSTVNGEAWYLVKSPAGTVVCDYLSLEDSQVS